MSIRGVASFLLVFCLAACAAQAPREPVAAEVSPQPELESAPPPIARDAPIARATRSRPPMPAPGAVVAAAAAPGEAANHATVRTYFATDRNRTGVPEPAAMFGVERGTLTYGYADVSIPHDHVAGELEAPSLWRLEFRENPDKHVVLMSAEILPPDAFRASVATRMAQHDEQSAFVFVHGFNVTFEDAARRTAQMAHDLKFQGAPIFYTWPSKGSTTSYTVDEQTVEWTQAHLETFLTEFLRETETDKLYLVAHSMGNRALTRAIGAVLAANAQFRGRVTEVILAAPDIDADVFRRDIVPALRQTGGALTLYASSRDTALAASKAVHGSPRAGDAGSGLVVVQGVETVDASTLDADFLGHSYYGENRSVIDDMADLILHRLRANQRSRLVAIDSALGRYWRFP